MIVNTPDTSYYAVIFTSLLDSNDPTYSKVSEQLVELANKQPGFLGIESARKEMGITVSYWKDMESIKNWKNHITHTDARKKGREKWYKSFKVRICKVEKEYGFER